MQIMLNEQQKKMADLQLMHNEECNAYEQRMAHHRRGTEVRCVSTLEYTKLVTGTNQRF